MVAKSEVLNRTQLTKAVAIETGYRRADVAKVLQALDTVTLHSLEQGTTVRLGLVSLRVVQVPAGEHRNPKTGAKVYKDAHMSVRPRLSATLKRIKQPVAAPAKKKGK
jgi:nucleoid DNA-binding protein